MSEIEYTVKKYRILQKTGENTANLMHPETEAEITLVKRGPGKYEGQATNVQDALKELDDKIDSTKENAVISKTSAEWNAQTTLVSQLNTIYVYTDAFTYNDGTKDIAVAGVKIGDGNAYLIDKPFITDYLAYVLMEHMTDNDRHVNTGERNKWNNKITCSDEILNETLVLTRN